MLPRPLSQCTMRLIISLIVAVYAVEAAKRFEGTLRSAVDAPPQDNLAVESASAEPAVVAAPGEYTNPGAPPPPKSAPEEQEEPEEEPAAEPAAESVAVPAPEPASAPETASGGVLPSAPSGISAPSAPANSLEECDPEKIGFELVTG